MTHTALETEELGRSQRAPDYTFTRLATAAFRDAVMQQYALSEEDLKSARLLQEADLIAILPFGDEQTGQ